MRLIDADKAIMAIEQHRIAVLEGHKWDEGIEYGYAAAHRHIVDIVEQLPSAQPDIIRCKDCAYCDWDVIDVPYGITEKVWWCNKLCAEANENLIVEPDNFCSWAERREDATD